MENLAIDSLLTPDESWLNNHSSLHHSIIFFLNGWENLHYELGIERVNSMHWPVLSSLFDLCLKSSFKKFQKVKKRSKSYVFKKFRCKASGFLFRGFISKEMFSKFGEWTAGRTTSSQKSVLFTHPHLTTSTAPARTLGSLPLSETPVVKDPSILNTTDSVLGGKTARLLSTHVWSPL